MTEKTSDKATEKLDLRGMSCPEPVIRTKKVMDKPDTASVEALVDDDVCVNNLRRLAGSLKASFHAEAKDGYFSVVLAKSGAPEKSAAPANHSHATVPASAKEAKSQASTGTIVFLTKDTLGEGDPEFSRTLLNIFLQTTLESGLKPRAILLINTAVRLLAKDSQALKVLIDLRAAGCEVLACGLCVDFYKVKDDVQQDQVTNMFAICEYLFAAERIIQP
jgi:selenium metabolism protein YedF